MFEVVSTLLERLAIKDILLHIKHATNYICAALRTYISPVPMEVVCERLVCT